MSLFELKEPKSTADFDSYFYFRWKILRKPHGQVFGTEKDIPIACGIILSFIS